MSFEIYEILLFTNSFDKLFIFYIKKYYLEILELLHSSILLIIIYKYLTHYLYLNCNFMDN